ncbi:MAG: nucleotidyltransferase [Acidithiobacillus caldus]|nr:nucleotidyltransferase [Acidithiobacillus caldus]
MAKSSSQPSRLRRLLAVESARIMAEEGIADYRFAKEKAARRLGSGSTQQDWPSNSEIQAELKARLQLFHGESQPLELRRLREVALEAMGWLKDFRPLLAGAVLNGTATRHSAIVLHLFADSPESVIFFLMDQQVAYEEGWQRLHFGDEAPQEYPQIRMTRGGAELRLVIFAPDEDRRRPASAVDGKPLQRVNAQQLQRLLDSEASLPAYS